MSELMVLQSLESWLLRWLARSCWSLSMSSLLGLVCLLSCCLYSLDDSIAAALCPILPMVSDIKLHIGWFPLAAKMLFYKD